MASTQKVPCPRGCGEKFIVQPIAAVAIHECPNNRKGVPYKDHSKLQIEVRVGGAEVGSEVFEVVS